MMLANGFLLCLFLGSAITAGNGYGPGVITVVVPEGTDAILPCSPTTKQSLEQKVFDWKKVGPNTQEVFLYDAGLHYNNGRPGQSKQLKGRVFHFPDQLKFGNASIIIRNAQIMDSGDYICVFPYLQSEGKPVNVKLSVEQVFKDRLEVLGAAPKPYIQIVNIKEDRALLRCEVRGATPKPKVEWQDSDGNILPAEEPQVSYRGDRYYIALRTTVTRTNTNRFLCVATQGELSHRTDEEIYVPYCAAAPKPDITILGVTVSGVELKCHVGGAFPQPKLQWHDSDGNVLPAEEPKVLESGGRYNVTLYTTVTPTNTNCFHCVVTQEGSYQVIDREITLSGNLFMHRYRKVTFEVGLLTGVFLGVSFVIAVLAVLMATRKLTISFKKGGLSENSSNRDTDHGSGNRESSLLNNGLD